MFALADGLTQGRDFPNVAQVLENISGGGNHLVDVRWGMAVGQKVQPSTAQQNTAHSHFLQEILPQRGLPRAGGKRTSWVRLKGCIRRFGYRSVGKGHGSHWV